MASTNKTPQLGLNQWAAGDPVLREDFNGDNGKIDAGMVAVEALAEKAYVVHGSFAGDGVKGRIINLGFYPRLLILQGRNNVRDELVIASRDGITQLEDGYVSFYENSSASLVLEQVGFRIKNEVFLNQTGQTTRYFAFR